jgi:RNA polymerase sigma-70 factor, ECF subfamily
VHTDSELMEAFSSRKDTSAFNEIIRRYQNLAWKVAVRFTADTEDSKDIVQDTFIRLMEASGRYTASASLSTFIYHIVTNLCLDFKKKKKLVIVDNIDIVMDSVSLGVSDENLDRKDALSQLATALNKLPKRQRLAIIYKYDHALSIREIADIMKTTEKSVERLLYHARLGLKKTLKHFDNF